MAASKSKAQPMGRPLENVPPDQKPAKTRTKFRKPKGKEVLLQPQPDLPSEPGPSSETAAEIEDIWSWTSLADSSASTHPAVFTKDGRYVFKPSDHLPRRSQQVPLQIFLFRRRIVRKNTHIIHGICRFNIVRRNPWWLYVTFRWRAYREDHVCALEPAQPVPTHYRFPRRLYKILGLPGWHSSSNYPTPPSNIHDRSPRQGQGLYLRSHIEGHQAPNRRWYISFNFESFSPNSSFPGKTTAEDNTHLYRVSLSPTPESAGLPVQESSEVIGIGKLRTPNGLAVSPSGSWVVAISGHKAHIASTTNPRAGFKKFTAPEHLTCLTFHPTDDCFATGDSKGLIRLWYCLTDGSLSEASGLEKRAQTTSFHWHAHAVSSLVFTPNGAYLLSGGEEAVLVIWQLHTNKKEFVPRVGAPILTIAISPAGEKEEEYLLGLSDSTYTFISSGSLKISRAFSQLKLGMVERF